MGKRKPDMIKGTLDMLVLKVVSLEPMHGWGISERIQQISKDALHVNQGSLYEALHKLTREGWIRSHWEVTEHNRLHQRQNPVISDGVLWVGCEWKSGQLNPQ